MANNITKQKSRNAPVPSRLQALKVMSRQDREFLPAALEILETPPSPVSTAFILLIGGIVLAGLVWSYFGHLDIIAEARGKIQPAGRVKVIQPLETGKVRTVNVVNGQHVLAGDVLVQLENVEAIADETSMQNALSAWQAEIARRNAAIDTAKEQSFENPVDRNWPVDIPESVRQREERIFLGDISQLRATLSSMEAQGQQKEATVARLRATVSAQSALVATLQKRVDMRTSLLNSDAGSKVSVIDALQAMETEQATLADEQGKLAESIADTAVIPLEIKRSLNTFIADNAQKVSEAERQADDVGQKLAKASARAGYTALISPIDGTVTSSTITTVGQVVGSGMELMKIVPDGRELEIQAYLKNIDIGFVDAGQPAIVKLDSFPFTQYGSIAGVIVNVGTDAIASPDASQTEADPTAATRQLFSGAERVQNLVYPVTVSVPQKYIIVGGKNIPLISGMTVSVEIRTGSRRVIEYLLSPLVDVASRALRER